MSIENIFQSILDFDRTKTADLVQSELAAGSDVYRINVRGRVREVGKDVVCVVKFKKPDPLASVGLNKDEPIPDMEYLYWHEE